MATKKPSHHQVLLKQLGKTNEHKMKEICLHSNTSRFVSVHVRGNKKDKGQRAKGKGQRAKGKGQRAKGKGQRAMGKGQRAKGKGQRAKGKGQRAKGKGQRAICTDFTGTLRG
jgi:hypothetical protein